MTSNSSETESALWSEGREGEAPPSFRDGPYCLNCLFVLPERTEEPIALVHCKGPLLEAAMAAVTAAVAFL